MKVKHTLVTADCGAVVCEALARHLDSLKSTLPADAAFRRKGGAGPAQADPATRTDVSVITSPAIDRDGEVIDPKGIDLAHYRANPVVLYGHDPDRPCGKALWLKETPQGVTAKTYYPARPRGYQGEWLPDFVFSMVHAEVLKGKSIGFLPLAFREPDGGEREKGCRLVISKSLLCEFSVVSVPCNPEALVQAIAKGIDPERLGTTWKVLGRAKPKTVRPPVVDLDPERIARRAVAAVLARWGA